MNLMQIQDDLQNIPNTPEGMQLLMQYANGSNPSVVPEYIALGELSRRRQFESVAQQLAKSIPKTTVKDQLTQAPPMVNPAAGIAGVNPAAPPVPVNPMMAVNNPMAAQERPYGGRTVSMADGGLTSVQEYLANRPGIASVPLNNMFNPSSYAGGGIVAFQNNEDQPVDEEMPANNTTSAQPAPRGGIGLATPIARPEVLTDDELIARDAAMRQKFGISNDPYAGARAKQLAMEERQKEKYAQDPLDRILGSLASYAKSDPTRGMAGLGTYAEASNLINKEQTAYRDKMEAASLAFEQATAKEEDARKRGDMQAVTAARAAQQKAQFDWQDSNIKLENAISSRTSAAASAQNASTAALRAKLEQERDPLERAKIQAEIDRANAQAAAAEASMGTKEQRAVADSLKTDQSYLRWSATAMPRDKGGQGYVPGTPEGEAVTSYLSALQASRAFEIRNNLPVGSMAPTPPDIKKERIETTPGRFFGTNETTVPGSVSPHKPGGYVPVPVPTKKEDLVVDKQVYSLPNGEKAIWNGKNFVVVK